MKYQIRFFDSAQEADSLQLKMLQLAITVYWTLFTPILIYSLGRHFYFQEEFIEKFSFKIKDAPAYVPRDPESHAFGLHYFGDYLLPHYWSGLPNPWLSGIPVNYPPIAIEFFGFFGNFAYKLGLVGYLLLMIFSLAFVFNLTLRERSLSTKIRSFIPLGLLSGPFLISLDRGNIAGYSVVLLFLFGYYALRNKWLLAALSISALVSLKLYALLIFFVFILFKQWKSASVGIAISIASFTLLLIPYPGSLFDTLTGLLHGISGFTNSSERKLYCYNHSFIGGLNHLVYLSGNGNIAEHISANAQVFSFLIGSLLVSIIVLFRHYLTISIILAFTLMSTMVPISYGYTLTWAIAAICIVLYRANQIDDCENKYLGNGSQLDSNHDHEKKVLYITVVYLTMILVPIPISLPDMNEFGCTTGVLPSVFVLLTVIWISAMVVMYRRTNTSTHSHT